MNSEILDNENEDSQREDNIKSFGPYKGGQAESLKKAHSALNERLESKLSPNLFLNLFVDHCILKMKEGEWKEFIDLNTPDSWRITEICKNPGNVAQILALFNERKEKNGRGRKPKAETSPTGKGH